ncbi:deoxyribose-phosphate aldolase [Amaricoccus sp.]|uniref:deoxyribose-phosphate aldolase n=1 Tax=Amaricoccus sp. TaxID=1872485 RepID=UPI002602F941|nr:deoxyribose-phosphate aldolase [Amaricoccus sp.]HRO12114.1 deoxyribose-phosphate aldolase [Amaricoccus sp.]
MDAVTAARRALAALDLTNLDDACDAAATTDLCRRAATLHGPVAAVCLWPRFVAQARRALEGTGIRIATVVNFPSGEEPLEQVRADTRRALDAGADEIDLVIPWRRLAAGHPATDTVAEIKAICGPATLKAILETGELRDPALVRRAADQALAGGADFLKTSTGKVPVNATPEAAEILLQAILDSGRDAGLKAAGGVRTTADAATYLALCDRMMGEGWATPRHFRIGASGVLAALLATLDGAHAPAARGY